MSSATRRTLAIAVVAGFVLGVVTQLGQLCLPDVLKPIPNSISPWLAVAFVIGATAPRPTIAAVAAWAALALALVGYYGMVWLQFGYGGRRRRSSCGAARLSQAAWSSGRQDGSGATARR